MMKTTFLMAAVLLVAAAGCARVNSEKSKTDRAKSVRISADDAKKMLDENPDAILLDVRTEKEFNELHIRGAVLLPVADIKTQAEKALPNKSALILVYCRSGKRSANAARELVSMGYANVYDFGGIINWKYETEPDAGS